MVRSPEERENTLRRSLSQSDGDVHRASDGLDPNAEVQQRAMQRYQRLVNIDPQIRVRLTSLSLILGSTTLHGLPHAAMQMSALIRRMLPRFADITSPAAGLARDDAQALFLRRPHVKGCRHEVPTEPCYTSWECLHASSAHPVSSQPTAAQASAYNQEKVQWLVENCKTCVQMFEGLCKVYEERPMFGFCKPGSDSWQTITYQQVFDRVVHFASGALSNLQWHPCLFHRLCADFARLCCHLLSTKAAAMPCITPTTECWLLKRRVRGVI